MGILIWFVLLVGTLLTLAYRRSDLRTATVVLGALLVAYLLLGDGGFLWKLLLLVLFGLFALLNVESIRRDNVTRRLFGIYRRMLPSMSKTEQEALAKLGDADVDALKARGVMIGDPGQVAAGLNALAEAGCQRVDAQWLDMDDIDGLELLSAKVFPQLN